MQSFSMLSVSMRRAGVAQITMARPDVFNAFNELMIAEVESAFIELAQDSKIRAIVLAGKGKHFSAGADLQWMQRASEASVEWNLQDARKFARMLSSIAGCPKPTIARIQGAALGGGVGLACACDIAIASDPAVFSVSEAKFGILPSVIGPYLVNAVGPRHAKRLALTATKLTAREATAIGLIQEVVPLNALDEAVDRTISELLACGPEALREVKVLYGKLNVGPIDDDAKDLTAQTISRVRGTDEAKEGFAAFLDKRSPSWITKQ